MLRAGPAVRQLSQDLPIFDSVWVDALVRTGVLTPYQSRLLYAGQAERLRVGDWIVVDRLGQDERCEIFLARHAADRQPATLTCWHGSPGQLERAHTGLLEKLRHSRSLASAVTLQPWESHHQGGVWWVVSPSVAGSSLRLELIRRGRFPAAVVTELARQILQEMQRLAQQGEVHGDLRPANLWLGPQGELQLLHPGLLSLLFSQHGLLSELPLDACDGVAPERLDPSQRRIDPERADMYALGCLLWQLLVGRPPFPMADPLLKLAAHQTLPVPRLTDWAPDTPPRLAELIQQCTARDPAERPTSSEALQILSRVSRSGPQRLREFRNSMESAAPRALLPLQHSTGRSQRSLVQPLLLAVLLPVLLVSALWFWPVWRPQAGSFLSPPLNAQTASPRAEHQLTTSSMKLPLPDQAGRVHLPPGRYQAGLLEFSGDLIIHGAGSQHTTIVVTEAGWRLRASRLMLSNLRIEFDQSLADSIEIAAQELWIERVELRRGQEPAPNLTERAPQPRFLWELQDSRALNGGRLEIRQSDFLLAGDLLQIRFPLTAAKIENVLQTGPGSLLILEQGVHAGQVVPLDFQHSTLRGCGPVVRWDVAVPPAGVLSIQGSQTVFALHPAAPLVEFFHGPVPSHWEEAVRVQAEGLIWTGAAPLVQYRETEQGPPRMLDANTLLVDGLLTGTVYFQGEDPEDPQQSRLREVDVPLLQAAELPGIVRSALP